MPCPHNEITIVQRSQRQSAVAAAAYQSGEKLFCEYDQQVKHYPEKRGIVHNEIRPLYGSACHVQERRQVLSDHVRLHRLGPESGSFRCRILYLGAVERVGEPVCGSRFGNLFPFAKYLCAACSRQARPVHLYGRSLDTGERHRWPLYLVAYPF